jgi:hypothetical protein
VTQVYVNASNVDDYLVESITRPAADPNAGEVYYRYLFRYQRFVYKAMQIKRRPNWPLT